MSTKWVPLTRFPQDGPPIGAPQRCSKVSRQGGRQGGFLQGDSPRLVFKWFSLVVSLKGFPQGSPPKWVPSRSVLQRWSVKGFPAPGSPKGVFTKWLPARDSTRGLKNRGVKRESPKFFPQEEFPNGVHLGGIAELGTQKGSPPRGFPKGSTSRGFQSGVPQRGSPMWVPP